MSNEPHEGPAELLDANNRVLFKGSGYVTPAHTTVTFHPEAHDTRERVDPLLPRVAKLSLIGVGKIAINRARWCSCMGQVHLHFEKA
jgi:hypothetical protein